MSSAKPKSAVVSVSTSGVLVASTPAALRAGTSKLLKPTAMLATIRSCGQAAATAPSMRSLPVVSAPTLPCRRAISSAGVNTLSVSLVSTSKC
ncbi:hypothetical protein D9M68_703400 [compost metagenome]